MVNFLFEKGWELFVCMCAKICILLDVTMFVYVLLLTRTYIRIFAYILACIFTYIHIFLLSVVGKGCDEGRECEKGRVDKDGMGNGLLQSEGFHIL